MTLEEAIIELELAAKQNNYDRVNMVIEAIQRGVDAAKEQHELIEMGLDQSRDITAHKFFYRIRNATDKIVYGGDAADAELDRSLPQML